MSFGLNCTGVSGPGLFRICVSDFPGVRTKRALPPMLVESSVSVGKFGFQATQLTPRFLLLELPMANIVTTLGPALHGCLVATEKPTIGRASRNHRHKPVAVTNHFALPEHTSATDREAKLVSHK